MFGARLKKLREAQKLSMEKLAVKAGVSKATIYRVEAGKRDPTLSTLRGIAKGLGITVSELVDPSS